ncbi:MAG: two-component response regulator [Devosia sp.]|nr:two-component response regulator [Devosia sp.]
MRAVGWSMRAHLRITTLSRVPTVSIVDDDDSVRGATARFVRLHGFLVHAFASAEEFLQSAVVDETACLITDVQMPGMSGYELQRRLIADGRRIPVIFITAFPQEGSRAKALKAGAIGFLTKPFDGNTLIGRLREAMKTG